jgi:IS30 family transposase
LGDHIFKIQERRRQVASLVSKSLTQTERARRLGVDQSTISDDIKALKEMSRQFVFDLAKSDLAFYYDQCLTGIQEAKREAWKMYEEWNAKPSSPEGSLRDYLGTAKALVKETFMIWIYYSWQWARRD